MRLAALLLLASVEASAFGTHCAPDDTIAFSCSVSASKVVSVCLVKGSNRGPFAVSFDYFDGEEAPTFTRGVNVSVNGKERELRCKGAVVSHLTELQSVVPCDAESALASCG